MPISEYLIRSLGERFVARWVPRVQQEKAQEAMQELINTIVCSVEINRAGE